MQVTDVRDHITHAVIGGGQTIDFGISSSAEFFNILSSTLYTDQKLAVIREVLCNAWDAHIEAGCTDLPVRVVIDDTNITVRDFGKGIHHDLIGPIYGMYGESTKKNDGRQTGGFGLGCKAPFAYTEHFEVISHHMGTKVVYAMSRSSAQANGKPGITPIVSMPTTETGLEVVIPLVQLSDKSRFLELIREITFNGDMNVNLNGEKLDTINFPVDSNYLIVNAFKDTNQINVLYGNVIYPVPNHESINDLRQRVSDTLNSTVSENYRSVSIIFRAPSHSISVTPSRESLSMQAHTCTALRTLFENYLNELATNLKSEQYKLNVEYVTNNCVVKGFDLLTERSGSAIPKATGKGNKLHITNIREYAQKNLELYYPTDVAYRKYDLTNRITALVGMNQVDKPLALSFLKEMKHTSWDKPTVSQSYWNRDNFTYTPWFHKKILKPLATKMLSNPVLDINRLFVSDGYAVSSVEGSRYNDKLVRANEARFTHLCKLAPYLRKIVVLIPSAMKAIKADEFSDKDGNTVEVNSGFLVYLLPRKQTEAAIVREFFNATGMSIIDTTTVDETEVEVKPKKASKPRKKGWVALSEVYSESFNSWVPHKYTADAAKRIEEPVFYMEMSGRTDSGNVIPMLNKMVFRKLFMQKYGNLGVVVRTKSQAQTLEKLGIPSGMAFLTAKVCDYISQSDAIKSAFKFDLERVKKATGNEYTYNTDTYQSIMRSKFLRERFNVVDTRTAEDMEMQSLYGEILDTCATRALPTDTQKQLTDLTQMLNALPVSTSAKALLKRTLDSQFLRFIDFSGLTKLAERETDPVKQQKIYNVLLPLLNL